MKTTERDGEKCTRSLVEVTHLAPVRGFLSWCPPPPAGQCRSPRVSPGVTDLLQPLPGAGKMLEAGGANTTAPALSAAPRSSCPNSTSRRNLSRLRSKRQQVPADETCPLILSSPPALNLADTQRAMDLTVLGCRYIRTPEKVLDYSVRSAL